MRLLLLLPILLAAGCEARKPDWAKQGASETALPPQVCARVRKGLEALSKGGFDYTDKGEATLPADVWIAMPSQQRDQLANTLAYQASCAAGRTSDAQTIVVRGEDGGELLRRTISTTLDTGDLLGAEGG